MLLSLTIWILSIPPQTIPAGVLPAEHSMPAAPAPLMMALFNENKAFSGLGEFGGELGNPFTVAGKLAGADGILQEGFEGFGAVLSTGVPQHVVLDTAFPPTELWNGLD